MEKQKHTQQEQAKLDAVKELLAHSNDSMDRVKLADIDRIERQAGMSYADRIKDYAKDNTPYKESRMEQRFTAIRSIKAVDGFIYIDVDEDDSRKAAQLAAFRTLGPLAKEEDIAKYVIQHTNHSKLMTIRTFLNNLRVVVSMVKSAPEYFGATKGGGEIKDLMEAAFYAIKEARAWLKSHNNQLPPDFAKFLANADFQVTDKAKFADMLGEGWESKLHKAGGQLSARQLITGEK